MELSANQIADDACHSFIIFGKESFSQLLGFLIIVMYLTLGTYKAEKNQLVCEL